jgi:hypothetical protein
MGVNEPHVPVAVAWEFDPLARFAEGLKGAVEIRGGADSPQGGETGVSNGFGEDFGGFVVVWIGDFPVEVFQTGGREVRMEEDVCADRKARGWGLGESEMR